MILEQFQLWSRTAPASGRADGVRVLARAILHTDLGAARRAAITLLTGFLDDPSPLVRMALAEAVADAASAPHHLVLALTDDQPAIAALVLGRSPVLTDADLVDCAATTTAEAQAAIAARPNLGVAVAAALAEVGAPQALVALACNPVAVIGVAAIRRMVERGGDDGRLREALLARSDLPVDVRLALVEAASRTLAALVADRGWMSAERMERVACETRDRATVTIGADVSGADRQALAAHLRASGRLTVGLAFRTILSGRLDLFRAVLCELTGAQETRVDALLRACGSGAFASLYRDAGLPGELLPAFRAAVRAAADIGTQERPGLSLSAVEKVIAACDSLNDGSLDALLVMLRRFEGEAARDEARSLAGRLDAERMVKGEPMLLPDVDAPTRARQAALREPRVCYTIDLAAIEAQLLAA